eukprot:tig00000970_g5854.t1
MAAPAEDEDVHFMDAFLARILPEEHRPYFLRVLAVFYVISVFSIFGYWLATRKKSKPPVKRDDYVRREKAEEFADALDVAKLPHVKMPSAEEAAVNDAVVKSAGAARPKESGDAALLKEAAGRKAEAVAAYRGAKLEEALAKGRASLEAHRKAVGAPGSLELCDTLDLCASLCEGLARLDEALAFRREAAEARAALLGPDADDALRARALTARTLLMRGDREEAVGMLEEVRAGAGAAGAGPRAEKVRKAERDAAIAQLGRGRDRRPPPRGGAGQGAALLLEALAALGDALLDRRKYGEAAGVHRQLLRLRLDVWGERHPDVAASLWRLAWLAEAEEDWPLAVQAYEAAVRAEEAALGSLPAESPRRLRDLLRLARACRPQHAAAETEAVALARIGFSYRSYWLFSEALSSIVEAAAVAKAHLPAGHKLHAVLRSNRIALYPLAYVIGPLLRLFYTPQKPKLD